MSDRKQGIRSIYNAIDEAKGKGSHGESSEGGTLWVAEAIIEAVRKRDKKVHLLLLPDMTDIGWVRLYMLNFGATFSSGNLPDVSSTVLVLFPRGQRETGICLAGGMAEAGEIGSTLDGDGDITLHDKYGNKITMQSGKIKIEGTIIEINGGVLPVARVTDTCQSPFGPLPITTGNNTFLA